MDFTDHGADAGGGTAAVALDPPLTQERAETGTAMHTSTSVTNMALPRAVVPPAIATGVERPRRTVEDHSAEMQACRMALGALTLADMRAATQGAQPNAVQSAVAAGVRVRCGTFAAPLLLSDSMAACTALAVHYYGPDT